MPQSWLDRVDKFAEEYMDGENVHSVGVGAGHDGPALMVYAKDPSILSLPAEFEGWEVIVQKSEPPVPLGS
jgi:hypothetical protein